MSKKKIKGFEGFYLILPYLIGIFYIGWVYFKFTIGMSLGYSWDAHPNRHPISNLYDLVSFIFIISFVISSAYSFFRTITHTVRSGANILALILALPPFSFIVYFVLDTLIIKLSR